MKRWPSLAEGLGFIYCLLMANDLTGSIGSSPFLRFGWLTFFLWFFPFLLYWIYPPTETPKTFYPFMILGIILSLTGTIGSLHVLTHLGLISATIALTPLTWWTIPWAVCALSWLPATGFFGRFFPITAIVLFRFVLGVLGLITGLLSTRQSHEEVL